MARPILFKCSQTGMNVQHWLADTPADDGATHAPVRCPACTRLHFINTSTGKLLGEKFGDNNGYRFWPSTGL